MAWELHLEVVYGMDEQINSGQPVDIYIFDRGTYERKYVRAIIEKDPAKLPGGEMLWVRNYQGKIEPRPWAIKILEDEKPAWQGL